jgi:hypothetical protein
MESKRSGTPYAVASRREMGRRKDRGRFAVVPVVDANCTASRHVRKNRERPCEGISRKTLRKRIGGSTYAVTEPRDFAVPVGRPLRSRMPSSFSFRRVSFSLRFRKLRNLLCKMQTVASVCAVARAQQRCAARALHLRRHSVSFAVIRWQSGRPGENRKPTAVTGVWR